jgi:hypothetical protein
LSISNRTFRICPLHLVSQVDTSVAVSEAFNSTDNDRFGCVKTSIGRVLLRLCPKYASIWIIIDGKNYQNGTQKTVTRPPEDVGARILPKLFGRTGIDELSSAMQNPILSPLLLNSIGRLQTFADVISESYNTKARIVWAHGVNDVAILCRNIGNSIATSYDADSTQQKRFQQHATTGNNRLAWPSKSAWEIRSWLWREESMVSLVASFLYSVLVWKI